MSAKEEIKKTENISVNEPKFSEKNTTKFNKDNNNFTESINFDYNKTLNQQKDAIYKTLDNTLQTIKKSTYEATREIPRYAQQIAEYQEHTIQTVKDIASDFIEAEKEVIDSFQSKADRHNVNLSEVWDWYNPQRIFENNTVMVNNFTTYLLNSINVINNTLESNMRLYDTALEHTRDNLKTLLRTNTSYLKQVN